MYYHASRDSGNVGFNLAEAARLLGGEVAGRQVLCPAPGHSPKDRSLSVHFYGEAPDGFEVYSFAGDDWRQCREHVRERLGFAARPGQPSRRLEPKRPLPRSDRDGQQLAKARWLWWRSQPARGTLAERYLTSREIRLRELPGTLRFLPAQRIGQHPAMIAVFGLPHENRPGELVMPPSRVRGVHLTLLKADGSGKADTRPNKLMVGASSGSPIVVAPANDLGGLAICEGIEDALSLHQATGLGAWAAGSANRLARLADLVPSSVETVTVAVDDDAAGRRGCWELARRLEERGIEAILFDLSRAAA